jgi:hypothetical protein
MRKCSSWACVPASISAMDEKCLANIGRITRAIELPVAQQHMQLVHAAR